MSSERFSSKVKDQTSKGLLRLKKGFSDLSTVVKSVGKKVNTPTPSSPSKQRNGKGNRIRQNEVLAPDVGETHLEGSNESSGSSNDSSNISNNLKSDDDKNVANKSDLMTTGPTSRWSNWAGNQTANPAQIFYPETMKELSTIIQRAKIENKKVRCAGSGHTWSSSSVVQEQDGFLVIVHKMNKIHPPVHVGGDVWTVEVESGVLVKELDDYLRNLNPPLALASNIVLDSARYGGILSMGCHGAATHSRTLPELVETVKILDANGQLNVFSKATDPVEFSAATVNLGLLGIIHTYTLRIEPLFKLLVRDTFPLLTDYLSSPVRDGPKIKAMVEANDQTEIFYWPFNTAGLDASNDYLWIKQWRRTKDLPVTVSPKQRNFQKMLERLQTRFGNQLYEFMAAHPSSTPFLCCLMYSVLMKRDDDEALADEGEKADEEVLWVPDAIHYQDGIDNIKCLDMEMAFKVDENYENVVKAWSYVIEQLYQYAHRDQFPLNLTLEMRFVKSSQMMMSNAYDDDPEAVYCMMEILSVANTKGFEEFSANVGKYWMDEFQAKPHWAKMWEHIPGMVPYLRRDVGGSLARLDQFERIRKKYDPEDMFMNATFAGLLGH
ncbi:hypothetical protein BGZ65_007267 [Modicella reniformis]|uniref:D-arabinono-1,4-lactone oxidase n=1 Tax=Modicella reniformis TaxID=1440133 RepID=A0A9P6IVD8_9FUNG|nr:hypothetical protein BGZ65_007267 [Modicella reniformis]